MAINSYGWIGSTNQQTQSDPDRSYRMLQSLTSQAQPNQTQSGSGSFNAPKPPTYNPQPSYGGSRQYTPGAGGSGLGYGGSNSPDGGMGEYMAGGQSGGSQQRPSYTPTSPTALNNLQQTWQSGRLGDIGWLGNKENRMIAEDYANYYGIPLTNLLLQQQAQGAQENQFAATFGEQQRVNQQQYGLQQAGSERENKALDFGMWTNQRDFEQAKNQFETTTGLSYAQLAAQVGTANADREMQKYGVDTQARTAAQQRELERYGIDVNAQTAQGQMQNQLKIAQLGNDMQRYGIDVGAATEKYGIDVGAATAAARLGYDYATMNQQDKQFVRDMALKELTQVQTYGIQRGQLGVQQSAEGRLQQQQALDEAYRRQAMAQEAQLMRENYQNQLLQSRYSAFGRAQTPNFRQVGGWR